MINSVFESTTIKHYNIGLDVITNTTLYTIYFFIILIFLYWCSFIFSFNKFEFLNNAFYFFFDFFYNIVSSYLNRKNSIIFFPFLLYLFFFIFFQNLVSLVPMVYATTSHFTFTLVICINIWLMIITLGFSIKSIKFFNIIIPKNVPVLLVPFLIFIEFISYIFRFISLSLRLFANILAGHVLIHVVAGALQNAMHSGSITDIFFLYLALTILLMFEVIVAFLQGYILVILSLIYLTDLETNNH